MFILYEGRTLTVNSQSLFVPPRCPFSYFTWNHSPLIIFCLTPQPKTFNTTTGCTPSHRLRHKTPICLALGHCDPKHKPTQAEHNTGIHQWTVPDSIDLESLTSATDEGGFYQCHCVRPIKAQVFTTVPLCEAYPGTGFHCWCLTARDIDAG